MNDNKHVVTRFVEELWNERNLEVAESIFDEDCHTHQLQSGSPMVAAPRGPAAIKAHVADWLSAFPDLKFAVEQMFADGDRVISQLSMDGTQTGQWLGIPPTRKRVNIRMITIHRIRNGKIYRGLGACGITRPSTTTWSVAVYEGNRIGFCSTAQITSMTASRHTAV